MATEPNDDFASRTILSPGMLTVDDSLTPGSDDGNPDLVLGVFDVNEIMTDVNDDQDDERDALGDCTASALFDQSVNIDGTIRISVSGFEDLDFDGDDDDSGDPHEESGDFNLIVELLDPLDNPVGALILTDTLVPGQAVDFIVDASDFGLVALNEDFSFNALTNNVVDGDLDYFTFTGLPAGTEFIAEITADDSSFDTMLGLLDDQGNLLDLDDDGGSEFLSRLEGVVPDNGDLNLVVTAFPDRFLIGSHFEDEEYSLSLELIPIPEPAAASLFLTFWAATLLRTRSRGL